MEPYVALSPADKIGETKERGFTENLKTLFGYQYGPAITRTLESLAFDDVEYDPDFDPTPYIDNYLEFTDEIVGAKNKKHLDFILNSIDENRKRRNDMARIPWYAPESIVAGVADPINIAFALPIAGQVGLLARGGMTIGQAALASAKGAFAAGVAGELVRAPFDPLATKEEVFTNILTTTALGGLLGTAPSAIRAGYSSINKSRLKNKTIYDQTFEGNVYTVEATPERITQLKNEVLNDKAKGRGNFAFMTDKELGSMYERILKRQNAIEEKIKDNRLLALDKEMIQLEKRRKKVDAEIRGRNSGNIRKSVFTKDEADQIELAKTQDDLPIMHKYEAEGYNLKKTAATENPIWKIISTPAKRIMSNSKVPDSVKRNLMLLDGNASMAMEMNTAGKGVQSIVQRKEAWKARGFHLERQLEKLYSKEILGRDGANFLGVDFKGIIAKYKKVPTYREWFTRKVDEYLEIQEDVKFIERYDRLPDTDKQFHELLRRSFEGIEQEAKYVSLFKQMKNVDEWIQANSPRAQRLRETIDELNAAEKKTQKDLRRLEKLKTHLDVLEKEIAYHEGLKRHGLSRTKFRWPIYYNKTLIRESREEFTDLIERHIRDNPKLEYFDNKSQEWKKKKNIKYRKEAEKIVATILEENPFSLSTNAGKTKHIRHRQLDIPEWKVRKFIVKTPDALSVYHDKMGRAIEWQRHFGGRSIDDLMAEMEEDMVLSGMTEKEIAKVKRDFISDYDRVMGSTIKNPDSLSNQMAFALKESAGMTYLHNAGISSITDSAMMIMERGFGKTLKPLLDPKSWDTAWAAKKDIERIVAGTDISRMMAKDRFLGESTQKLEKNTMEKIFDPITQAYYNIPLIGNNLGFVTKYFKIMDGVYRQSHYIELANKVKNNSATVADVEYLARYGINTETAMKIADMPWEGGPTNKQELYYANIDEWPSVTNLDRDLILQWETAMNTGSGNTVMHATSFDKPLMVDGAMYVRHYPWMEKLPLGGLKADPRASTANIKYARLESRFMTMPFQFMNFALAATNRITTQVFDPARQHRLSAVVSLLGMSYLSLSIKKDDWWFEQRSFDDILLRVVDHSGVMGIYSDLAYMALHIATGSGVIDGDEFPIRGKYRPTQGDAALELFGAAPGMLAEWVIGAKELLDGDRTEAAERLKYNLPWISLYGLNQDVGDLISGK